MFNYFFFIIIKKIEDALFYPNTNNSCLSLVITKMQRIPIDMIPIDVVPINMIHIISVKYEHFYGTYEGQILYGLPHGYGIDRSREGDSYSGEFEQGRFHGKGQAILRDGTILKGTYRYGIMEGYGEKRSPRGTYKGNFIHSIRDGYGSYKWKTKNSKGFSYEGMFKDDKINGYGIMKNKRGIIIEGEFCNGNHIGENKYIPRWKRINGRLVSK